MIPLRHFVTPSKLILKDKKDKSFHPDFFICFGFFYWRMMYFTNTEKKSWKKNSKSNLTFFWTVGEPLSKWISLSLAPFHPWFNLALSSNRTSSSPKILSTASKIHFHRMLLLLVRFFLLLIFHPQPPMRFLFFAAVWRKALFLRSQVYFEGHKFNVTRSQGHTFNVHKFHKNYKKNCEGLTIRKAIKHKLIQNLRS